MLENQGTIQKIGFHIGWDFYVYSATLPPHANEYQDIVKGYQEAASRAHQRKSDRYERKCLQLRLNAYIRGKAFDENITPDYLRQIDTPICPVTNLALTHGSGAETDWSVDRIHNDSGYTVGNLVIVSAKANKAKGAKTYDQIVSIVETLRVSPDNDYGLNLYEWIRWQSICSKVIPYDAVKNNVNYKHDESDDPESEKSGFVFTFAPCIISPPPGIFIPITDILQITIAYKVASFPGGKTIHQDMVRVMDQKKKAEFQKLMRAAQKVFDRMSPENPLDIWFNQTLFRKFLDFYTTHCQHRDCIEEFIRKSAKKIPGAKKSNLLEKCDINAWHVDTKGYITRS
jgi:hypothetical protein